MSGNLLAKKESESSSLQFAAGFLEEDGAIPPHTGWSSHQGATWCPLQMRSLHQIPRPAFKHERRPTNFDKKVLVWAGRFKKEEDIPKYITSEVLDAARNTVRIKVCYIMIALTLLGCLAMVITGKEAAKKDHTLLRVNEEKKAKWRAEAEKDQEAAAVKAQ
ncbi:protein FAM162B isoform X2 [Gallus gallus]|uniref:Protein FAM162B n=1 Tax=Gallus gallus TaxID=9031 RepID=A0A8V0ZFB2_CHICK|nr:protein FAM162B isoform X2 [Gallus gallus]XP_046796938.1 protein FAM162B isoform X2 [Gallus gallus]